MTQLSRFTGVACLLALAAGIAPVSVWAQQPAATASGAMFTGTQNIAPSMPLRLEPTSSSTWNLGNRAAVQVTLKNTGTSPVTVQVRAENADAAGMKNTVRTFATVAPGKPQTVLLRLTRRPQDPTYAPFQPYFMYKKNINVYDNTVDATAIARVVVSVEPGGDATPANVAVLNVQAVGEGTPDAPPFLPFVDKYGQYVHSDWVGKI